MLEHKDWNENYRDWDGYCSADPFTEGYYEGFQLGRREAAISVAITVYRISKEKEGKEEGEKMKRILAPDFREEIARFEEKYGKLSPEKMTKKIMRESEYLIGIGGYRKMTV